MCMQFDSQWDTHPDNTDQCCFIKPCMRWRAGGGPGVPVCLQMVQPLLRGGWEGVHFFPGKKTEESILGTGGV